MAMELLTQRRKRLLVLATAALCQAVFVTPAHAYLDPGTGSLVFQMVIAVIVGAAAALRIYWRRLKALFGRAQAGPPAGETGSGDSAGEAEDAGGQG